MSGADSRSRRSRQEKTIIISFNASMRYGLVMEDEMNKNHV